MIKIINLSKKYNDFYALKDINLTLPSKGLIGIVGSSGSGKSNFYRIFHGGNYVKKENL